MLTPWNSLPAVMKTPEVKRYYDALAQKKAYLCGKRLFDVCASFLALLILSPLFLILAVLIRLDSPGPVFYRQERVTAGGRHFRIHKFRSMVANADRIGAQITSGGDARVTKIGRFIRRFRLDEISQLIDVLKGDMSFVGTRPEVPKFVERYTPEMYATLLLPAGVTSLASIRYKDEAELLDAAADPEKTYAEEILPAKMAYNLEELKKAGLLHELKILFLTVAAVLGAKV